MAIHDAIWHVIATILAAVEPLICLVSGTSEHLVARPPTGCDVLGSPDLDPYNGFPLGGICWRAGILKSVATSSLAASTDLAST